MDKKQVKKRVCTEGVRLPEKAHSADAGYDVFLLDDVTLEPGERKRVRSGFKIIIQEGCRAEVKIRSSSWLRGLQTEGTIDAKFRGELYYMLENKNNHEVELLKNSRPVQLVFSIVPDIEMTLEENVIDDPIDDRSLRGEGGFGSTGK